jgi:hypothetical protein
MDVCKKCENFFNAFGGHFLCMNITLQISRARILHLFLKSGRYLSPGYDCKILHKE